ncbi:MAG: sn-glycerol-3-phosphate ABC transporter ATP-binding protein UgpC [Candidatus Eremiobacteraeota bacterium]|nr:sn-glycerol-3-phosphate ABC transporter ATP-binding protein UgpC [Candidatus Eremiobacteraeota bacterium]
MAQVRFDEVNKIFQGTAPVKKKWWEFWRSGKRPNEVHVVKGVSMNISDGEFLVLVGPSGCGKSTTLRMLAGLEEVTSGEIFIDDCMVNDITPKDRDIAMVFQNYALYPHMNVYENMAFGLRLRKFQNNEIEKRVNKTAKLLGIQNLLNRKPKELSGGQRQRVAMGRAIVREPKVFLMDEPLSNLDAKLRVQMRAELQKLHHRLGITTIYVTHDQVEAMTLGNRIALLNHGVIQQLDTPLELYNHPSNKFVAGFIGSPSMNFVDATILEEDGEVYVKTSDFKLKIHGEHGNRLRPFIDKEVIMGIRPEDIADEKFLQKKPEEENTFDAMVEVQEPLGAEIILYIKLGEESLIARVNPQTGAKVGEKLRVVFDTEKVQIFDRETEINLIVAEE